ncbi:MAG: hypothetical protein ACK5N8_03325 [Alphaproteobacteria bacterium]
MTITDETYEQALLAKFAYDTPDELSKASLIAMKDGDGKRIFTDQEAEYIATNFKVLSKINSTNGFKACWVEKLDKEGNGTGEIMFCIAGTDIPLVQGENLTIMQIPK